MSGVQKTIKKEKSIESEENSYIEQREIDESRNRSVLLNLISVVLSSVTGLILFYISIIIFISLVVDFNKDIFLTLNTIEIIKTILYVAVPLISGATYEIMSSLEERKYFYGSLCGLISVSHIFVYTSVEPHSIMLMISGVISGMVGIYIMSKIQ